MCAARVVPIVQPSPPLKGRGASVQIEHRFTRHHRVADDESCQGENAFSDEVTSDPATQIRREWVKSILSRNESPDLGFDVSINPYRGCEHGCIYCYARPTHAYLDLSPGLDFETQIVAKVNAAQRLEQAFESRGYEPRPMILGAVTDAYQPAERRLLITRQVLQVLERYEHACTVITKSALIERDLDVLASMASNCLTSVVVSVTTLNPELSRVMEPRATAPHRRLQTIERLARAGIPVGVSVSPLIPFLNEPELERILAAASRAGATFAFGVVLRLPWEVAPLFQQWLRDHYPERAQRVMARVRDMRGGRDNDSRFGTRMKGEGVWAELLRTRLRVAMQRHGLSAQHPKLDLGRFRRPEEAVQPSLF